MKIGIIGAMAQEIEQLSTQLENRRITQLGTVTLYQGQLKGHDIVLLQSGIGKVAAAIGTTLLLQLTHPDIVINTGSAGGVANGLSIGDVVISTETAYHDVDVCAFGYQKGQLPGCQARFVSDEKLTALTAKIAESQGCNVVFGLICSGDSFIHNAEKRAAILMDFPDAVAVEMEAAAIAQVCQSFNVPFVVVRAVSDTGDNKAEMAFEEFLPLAAERSSQMVLALIDQL